MRGIVVTGASSGFGVALAQLYAGPGVMLGLVGRDLGRLERVAAACRAKCAQTDKPLLLARRCDSIAIVSSLAALRGLPYSPGYSASKAGVRAYGEALRVLLAPAGLKVSVIRPGFFSSPVSDRRKGTAPFKLLLEHAATGIKRGIDNGAARITFPGLPAAGMRLADLMPAAIGDKIFANFIFDIAGQ